MIARTTKQQRIKNRKSMRLKGYDYSQNGAYFITICTKNREHFFGQIKNKKMITNNIGKNVIQCWKNIPQHYSDVVLDMFTIMPNHIHGIIFIQKITLGNECSVGVQNLEPLRDGHSNTQSPLLQEHKYQKIIPRSLGSIIRGFKIGVTKWCRTKTEIFIPWQRNFNDHIIRDEEELHRIREYVLKNPENWEDDENNIVI